jgi:thioredoxin 1
MRAVSMIHRRFGNPCVGERIMASENVLELTDQNFEQEVLKSETPVLVDFWAEWCMPCKMLTPTIEKLAKDYTGKVKVGKVDTDSNRDISIKYQISAIPTVILFKNGQVHQKFVGLKQEREFKEALDLVAAK